MDVGWMMSVEQSVKLLAGETKVLEENLPSATLAITIPKRSDLGSN
jgi:hypothetical protein